MTAKTSLLKAMNAHEGDVLQIPLTSKKCAFAQIFCDGLFFAYFDLCVECYDASLERVISSPLAFRDYSDAIAVKHKRWKIIGNHPIPIHISSEFRLYRPSYENDIGDKIKAEEIDCRNKKIIREIIIPASPALKIRKSSSQFWAIEDELRARLLNMPPKSFSPDGELSPEIQRFYISTLPGITEVVGEHGTLGNDHSLEWLENVLKHSEGLSEIRCVAFICCYIILTA